MKKKQYLAWFLVAAVMTGMSTVPAAAEELQQMSAESSADETAEVHEDDSDAVLSDTVVADPADETETDSGDNSSQTEGPDTDSDTDAPVSNEEAFDDLILEDENGVMEEDDGSTSGPEAGKGTGNTGNTDTGLGELEEITDVAKQTGQYLEDINITVEKEEVTNCVYWRQDDASKNSIQMVGQANFSHSELQHKSRNDIQDMLITQKDINWNDFPVYQKRGSCCIKEEYWIDKNNGAEFSKEYSEVLNRKGGAEDAVKRSRWIVDKNIPIFKGEDRKYIDRLVYIGE